jgi:protocatechuate 3,4-dioxygenase beta subunit
VTRTAALDRAAHALAAIACVVFLLGLADSPRVVLEAVSALAVPSNDVPRDARLVVEVSTRSGEPLRDASVSVFWERDGAQYFAGSGRSDRTGSARLGELPRGSVWVLASAPGHARASERVSLGADTTVRLTLDAERTLVARITDERGTPIARATVLVTASDPLPFGNLTGPDGKATVARLPPSPWTVKASAAGYESVERTGVNGELTLALRRLGSLLVRVEHAAGKPAAGATVAIAGSSLWPARRAQADERGIARIAGLLAGSYDLQATLGSEVSEPALGLALERGEDRETTLVLLPGRSVTALVTDGAGESPVVVPNADVVLTPSGLASFPLRGRTGTDGKVTLGPVAQGPLTLAARAEGFVSGALVAVPEATKEPVRVALVRGATLRGEVVDARGFPIDGASIEVIGTDSFGLPIAQTPLLAAFQNTHFDWSLGGPLALVPAGELGVMPGPVPPIPPPGVRIEAGADLFAIPDDAPREAIDPWVTRSDGGFVARPVTPGRVRALARHPDYVEGTSDPVTLGPGGEAHVKIVLLQGGTLSGRVLDDRGMPVAQASIEAASSKTSLTRFAVAKDDGSFEIPALPAEVVVSVTRPGPIRRVALRETVAVKEGERTEIELTLPAPRGLVRFVVDDTNGAPVELAQVTVLSLDPAVPLRETVFTDSAGGAEIDDAEGLALRVVVEAPGFPRRQVVLEHAGELLRVTLEAGVIVAGRVTAVRGRQGVEGALVALLSDGTRRTAKTDADGNYRIADVAPGHAKLAVSHPEYAELDLDVEVKATTRSDRPFELETVDLEEPGSAEGDVVDARGEPVSGARVSTGVAAAYLPAGALPRGVAVTDASGHFTLTGVRPGRRTLEAFSALAGRGRATIEVTAGRVVDRVRIELSPSEGDEPLGEAGVAVTLGERGPQGHTEVVIVGVAESSEAERVGLAIGDVLATLDGKRVADMREARQRLAGRPGSDVLVEVERSGTRLTLRVARETLRR